MTMLFGFIPAGALAENYKVCEASNPQEKTSYCLKCVCSVKSDSREAHDFAYTPNSDTLTHRRACKVCGIRIKNR